MEHKEDKSILQLFLFSVVAVMLVAYLWQQNSMLRSQLWGCSSEYRGYERGINSLE